MSLRSLIGVTVLSLANNGSKNPLPMSLILPAAFPRHLSSTRIRPLWTIGVCVVSDLVACESIRTADD
jgi:hypothetical protein